jgi:DNA polymerase-4
MRFPNIASRFDEVIFHLDLDSFFVSCERLLDPSLNGIPLAVGGVGGHGVIASASYEARKFGVRSAMPTVRALKLCPHLKIIRATSGLYSKKSKEVFDVVARFAPTIEKVSVDEAYLDMRGTRALWGEPPEAAEKIRAAVFAETQLTCSIGIASNRRVAKIATDFNKPNGHTYVAPGTEAEFLAPLEVKRVPGIGPSTEAMLAANSIFHVSDLQAWPIEKLKQRFGESYGHFLYRASRGEGSTAFFEEAETRSMSREETYSSKDYPRDRVRLRKELWTMVREIAAELRAEEDPELRYAQAVRLKLRYPDFETLTRSKVLDKPTRLEEEIFTALEPLLDSAWSVGKPVRLLGAGVVLGNGVRQLGLFESVQTEVKKEKLAELKDSLRAKFGEDAVKTGRDF